MWVGAAILGIAIINLAVRGQRRQVEPDTASAATPAVTKTAAVG